MSRVEEYNSYVERLMKDRGISKEEAEKLRIVKEYWKWLGERDKNAVVDRASDT